MDSATSMKQSFYARDVKNQGNIQEGNNAHRLKHARQSLGQIGHQTTNMVSENSLRYKWVQPRDVDMGRTNSMGFSKH